ncbi:adenosine deaminase family protein [Pontiella agarivorans]|uniref:adenosine deaminase n=1 Tax=Pontiella agarivorans TaxID=3038953 RepID=A0ABU5MYA5_9BACT|nr:adenosine deaminase family protein [Pontiella agarivorans]MDZ8119159.1 adenosine deaminase family protein [Pontiella agarivorans]
MTKISEQFIRKIPKTDLHLHLDGSLRLPTLIEMAKADKVKLPSSTEAGLNKLVFKPRYENLGEYLTGFAFTVAVLQTPEHLERAAFELAEDAFEEGVRYIEIRFAPQLHISRSHEIEPVVLAVFQGLEKAKKHLNASMAENDLPFEYGIILCAMRRFNRHMSPYYARLFARAGNSGPRYIFARASLGLVKEAVRLRDKGLPIVGFDLAGEEAGYPAAHHLEAFDYAHKHFLRKTVHAGEAYGPESIFQAITECHANRIGHGTFLFSEEAIKLKSIKDKKTYIEQLAEYIANQRIMIEVCPTSNLQTIPEIKSMENHPLQQMVDNGLSVTINTDNRLVSHTSVTNELLLCTTQIDLTDSQFRDLVLAGFKRSFFPRPFAEKRQYVMRAIQRYDELAEQYLT